MGVARRTATRLRGLVTLAVTALGVFVMMSCSDGDVGQRHCDYVLRRCRTVCDYWCDGYGCYPSCYDQCWDDCYQNNGPEPGVAPPPSLESDAAAPPATGGQTGTGVLCTSCASNGECEANALCIFRGGPPPDAATSEAGAPTGRGFCGQACMATVDCPQGFSCGQIGASKQCLPTTGLCP